MSSFKAFIEDIYNEIFDLRSNTKEYAEKLKIEFDHYKGNNIRHRPGTVPLQTREGRFAVEEAYKELLEKEQLCPLELSIGLCNAAIEHCCDTGKLGIVGHIGSMETSLQKRIEVYGKWSGNVIEALDYGSVSGAEVVLSLLIDDGLITRPHRKSLLNPLFTKIGVGAAPHTELKSVACVIFAAGYTDNEDLTLMEPSEELVPRNPEIHNWLEGAVKLAFETSDEVKNGQKIKRIRKYWEMADGSIVTQDEIEKIEKIDKDDKDEIKDEYQGHERIPEEHKIEENKIEENDLSKEHEIPKEIHEKPIVKHKESSEGSSSDSGSDIGSDISSDSDSDSSDEEREKNKKRKNGGSSSSSSY
ncbi:hypothetical protein SteCoe_19859 [Stentor coeruleus]|uniref:SCP domain-containing protein n=1 Tax=Stentor coeruleus TaxID=5963 RepID=A0A1R2BT56_9CILI|nr:hypothetical protein SteCoe_19859 [Stentor coeruleus]